jgi:hypothetical protein
VNEAGDDERKFTQFESINFLLLKILYCENILSYKNIFAFKN